MVMGFVTGEIFTREEMLVAPTRSLTQAIIGKPLDRLLTVMPLAEHGGSVIKLFYFFGFTIGMGVILNSLGLLINIYNKCALKKYETAFFGKTGLAGLLLFWYAIFIAVRCIFFKGRFESFDLAGILVPCICILGMRNQEGYSILHTALSSLFPIPNSSLLIFSSPLRTGS